jgi:hypothetical protein
MLICQISACASTECCVRNWASLMVCFCLEYFDTYSRYKSVETTNKMQPCNRIYYSKIYWRVNMFRAAYRSSSGAPNCLQLWFISPCGDRPLSRLGGNSITAINFGTINSITKLHLFGCFYWFILRCTDPWILNIKLLKILHVFHLYFSSFLVKVNKFMLVFLYCYMRKFRTCEPPEQYLLCTFSADMCPCTESGIVCGLCSYCAQTNCRRTVSVLCRLGWNAASKVCRSARVRVRSAYTLISFHIAHHVLFPNLFGVSSQSGHVTEGRCS